MGMVVVVVGMCRHVLKKYWELYHVVESEWFLTNTDFAWWGICTRGVNCQAENWVVWKPVSYSAVSGSEVELNKY